MSVQRILVGVDGSDYAQRALAWAIELATALDAEVVAVHALGLLERLGSGPPVPVAGHRSEVVERFERDWCHLLDGAGVRSQRLVHDGNPVSVVLATAAELDVDLIVIGARGVGGLPEQLLGSTSHQVAERATQPVVIVPPAGRG